MSATEFDRPPATSIETLDLHLRYVQVEMHKLVQAIPQMATKADLAQMATKADLSAIGVRLDQFATKDDVRGLRVEVDTLRSEVTSASVPSAIKRFGAMARDLAAIAGVLAALGLLFAKLTGQL